MKTKRVLAAAHPIIGALLLVACATTPSTTPHAVNAVLTTEYNQKLAKRIAIREFSLEDSVVSIVDFQWTDVSRSAGEHNVEWRWYKEGTLVSKTAKNLNFKGSPYTTWTRRAAGSFGPGHFSVATVVDGQVASTSEFDIKP